MQLAKGREPAYTASHANDINRIEYFCITLIHLSSQGQPMKYHALCFVDMPFRQKPDFKSSMVVDSDQVQRDAIQPAIDRSG
jgi:hypothetical protein